MTRNAKSHVVLGKLSALSMAVIMLLMIFVPMLATTVDVGAASSSYSGALYIDFSKNSTWLAYAGTGRVTVDGKQITSVGDGLYKTNTSGFINNTITVEYSYSIPNQANRLFYKGSYTYAYFWQNGGATNLNGAWPGMSMTKFDTDKYYCDYSSEADMVVFTDNSNKTGDLTINTTNNVYDNGWTAYNASDWTKTYTKTINLSDRANDAANTIYMDASGNVEWSRYDHSQSDPYTMTAGEEVVEVKLYAPDWNGQANVMYDMNDPLENVGASFTGTGTVTVDETAYDYFVLEVPQNSVFKFYKSSSNSGTGELTVPSDYENLYYSVAKAAWVTKDNLADEDKSDFQITSDNFSNPGTISGSGSSVIGVDAMYFDYLSNNERTSGWRHSLNDDTYTDDYRKQFSDLNDLVRDVALGDTTWRYPMFFGDDYNATYFINGYWNTIGSRSGSTQGYFQAVNNSNFLGGSTDDTRARSIQGLVNSSLNSGNLTVGSNGTLAPYFNYDLLHSASSSSSGTNAPSSDEIWIEQGVSYLQRGDGSTYEGGDKKGELQTKTGSDGLTYYVVTKDWVGSNTYIGFNNNSNIWKTYQVSDYWGKAIWNSGDINTSIGGSSSSSPYAAVVSAKFPFVATKDESTGVTTYSFDSTNAKDNVYFDWSQDGVGNYTPTKVNYGAGTGYGIYNKTGSYGIFPFNNGSSTANCSGDNGVDANGRKRDYGFGIKMKVYFTLPENGIYGSESSSGTAETEIWIQKVNVTRIHLWNSGGSKDLTLSNLSTAVYDGHEFYRITSSDIGDYTSIGWEKNSSWQSDSEREISSALGNAYWDNGSQAYAGVAKSTSGGSTGEHAKFEYSGDDDLWVFVDGQLVLDLGGAHRPTSGSIDFGYAPGKIKATADKVYLQTNGGDYGTTDTEKSGSTVETIFDFDNTNTSVRHEMVVYYMERGTNDSNLKVSYSIQPVTNDLRIDKSVDVSDVNDGLKDVAKTVDNFTFTTSQSSTQKAQDTFGDGGGVLYSATDKNLTVNENMTIAETYSGALKYTTESYVEDINAQQQINSTGNNASLNFNYINAKNISDINTSLSAHFTNKTVTQPLTVTKNLFDEDKAEITDSNIDFSFIIGVALDGSDNYTSYPLTYKLYDKDGNDVLNSDGINLYTAETGRFKLKAGYKAVFDGIPEGAAYKISEESLLPGYSFERAYGATKASGDYCTGTITSGSNEVEIANKFVPVKSNLQVFKNLDGKPYTGSDFTFTQTLLYCNNNSVPQEDYSAVYSDSVSTASGGNVTFKNVTYQYTGDYIYLITESLSTGVSTDKYIMDSTSTYYAKATVSKDASNNLTVDIAYYREYNISDHTVSDQITDTVPTFNNTTAAQYTDVWFIKRSATPEGTDALLDGAEFTLYIDENCTTVATVDNASAMGKNFKNPAISGEGDGNEGTGKVIFKDVKYEPGQGGATYYFKETKAPNGYQLLTGTFRVDIAADGSFKIYYNGSEVEKSDDFQYAVYNNIQSGLPTTGGMGVTMLYVLGAAAVIGAITLFVLDKKNINVAALAKRLIHRR